MAVRLAGSPGATREADGVGVLEDRTPVDHADPVVAVVEGAAAPHGAPASGGFAEVDLTVNGTVAVELGEFRTLVDAPSRAICAEGTVRVAESKGDGKGRGRDCGSDGTRNDRDEASDGDDRGGEGDGQ